MLFITSTSPNMDYYESEHFFVDPQNSSERCKFPSIEDEASVDLSVIVPAYNEEERSMWYTLFTACNIVNWFKNQSYCFVAFVLITLLNKTVSYTVFELVILPLPK